MKAVEAIINAMIMRVVQSPQTYLYMCKQCGICCCVSQWWLGLLGRGHDHIVWYYLMCIHKWASNQPALALMNLQASCIVSICWGDDCHNTLSANKDRAAGYICTVPTCIYNVLCHMHTCNTQLVESHDKLIDAHIITSSTIFQGRIVRVHAMVKTIQQHTCVICLFWYGSPGNETGWPDNWWASR